MLDKLTALERQYDALMQLLGSSEVQTDPSEYRKHAKALSEIEPLVERFREYRAVVRDIAQTEEVASSGDADMRELAQEELKSLTARRDALLGQLKVLLVPKDPNDEKTSCSKSAPARAATKRRFLPQSFSGCTASTRSGRAGGSN
jgi:peptide chain release factor 1